MVVYRLNPERSINKLIKIYGHIAKCVKELFTFAVRVRTSRNLVHGQGHTWASDKERNHSEGPERPLRPRRVRRGRTEKEWEVTV